MKISVHTEEWELQTPFRIAGSEWTVSTNVVVHLWDAGSVGRGEAQGVYYLNETAESMLAQIEGVAKSILEGASREELLELLPPGGARNAIDCALWDLEAKRSGKTIWELTGIDPKPVVTVFTIGLEKTPQQMADKAASAAEYPVLKIKLNDDRPVERLAAIRKARPDATLVADVNEGWSFEMLREVLPACVDLNMEMIEQPLPRGKDEDLAGFESPITLAADESCLHTGELDVAAARYSMINIKLDKTGGLTEALALAHAAKQMGCKLMVGNMVGTSLSMAPSFVVAQLCDFVDIDGPLLLKYDCPNGLTYDRGRVSVFDSVLWG